MNRPSLICTTAEPKSIDTAACWHFIRPVQIADIDPMADKNLKGPSLPDLVGNCPVEGALSSGDHTTKKLG